MYTSAIINAHQGSYPEISLHAFANAMCRKIGPSRVYRPIKLKIKMTAQATDPEGTVLMPVLKGNKGWYSDACEAIQEMTGRDNIDIVDYCGNSIKGFGFNTLQRCGELDIIDSQTRKLVRTPRVVAPPISMSVDKKVYINQWFSGKQAPIRRAVMANMDTSTLSDISVSLKPKGMVFNAIRSCITSDGWEKKQKTFALDTTTRSRDPALVANHISSMLLSNLRTEMSRNQENIDAYMDVSDTLWSQPRKRKKKFPNKKALVLHIVNNAIYNDTLVSNICDTVNTGRGLPTKVRKRVYVKKDQAKIDAAYRLFSFNQVPVSKQYIQLCKSPMPEPYRKREMPRLVKSCDHDLIPIQREMPRLIEDESYDHEFVPIHDEMPEPYRKMPNLVKSCDHEFVPIHDEMPSLVEVESCDHEFVPIQSEMPEPYRKMPRLVQIKSRDHEFVPNHKPKWVDTLP